MIEVGLQLWSFYHMERESLEKCIRTAAELGYSKIETAGFFDLDAKRIKELCDELGIYVCGTHSGAKYLTPDVFEKTLEDHLTLGCKNLIIPAWKVEDPDAREELVATINRIHPVLEENGITLHWHNHSPELMLTDDQYYFHDMLCERTKINFQVDVYHTFAAGLDPVDFIERYKDRVKCIRLRDGMGYQLEGRALGEGLCPIKKCLDYAVANGLDMTVENAAWEPDAVSQAKKCIDYIKANCVK